MVSHCSKCMPTERTEKCKRHRMGPKEHHHPKKNGNGRWERNIVSVCINACDQFTFINEYLLHPQKDKSLEMLAITTCFISYIQIKSRRLMGEQNNSYKIL